MQTASVRLGFLFYFYVILVFYVTHAASLNGFFVVRRTRDRKVAGSTPGRGAIKSTRSIQPSIPPGKVSRVPACMARVTGGAHSLVSGTRWHCVIPYGKWRPVALRWGSHEELYRPLPFTLLFTSVCIESCTGPTGVRQVQVFTVHQWSAQLVKLLSAITLTGQTPWQSISQVGLTNYTHVPSHVPHICIAHKFTYECEAFGVWQAELTFIHFSGYLINLFCIPKIIILDIWNDYFGYPKYATNFRYPEKCFQIPTVSYFGYLNFYFGYLKRCAIDTDIWNTFSDIRIFCRISVISTLDNRENE